MTIMTTPRSASMEVRRGVGVGVAESAMGQLSMLCSLMRTVVEESSPSWTPLTRRAMLSAGAAVLTGAWFAPSLRAQGKAPMYGLIGKMLATPGNRDALV